MNDKKYILLGVFFLAAIVVFSFNGWGAKFLASLIGVSGSKQMELPKDDELFYEFPLFDSTGQIYETEIKQSKTVFDRNGKPEPIFHIGSNIYSRSNLASLGSSDVYEQSISDNQASAMGVIVELEADSLLKTRAEAMKLTKSEKEIDKLLEKQKNKIIKEHESFKKNLQTLYKKSLGFETDVFLDDRIRVQEFKSTLNGFAIWDVSVADATARLAGMPGVKKVSINSRAEKDFYSSFISSLENCADPNGDGNLSDILKVCVATFDGIVTDSSVFSAKDSATLNGISFKASGKADENSAETSPYLKLSEEKIDLGLDFNGESSWKGEGKLILTNLTDSPAAYSVSLDCCGMTKAGSSQNIKTGVEESNVTLAPGGAQVLNFNVSVPNNGVIPNGRYQGFLKLSNESLKSDLKIPVTFFKGYSLKVYYGGGSPDVLTLYRDGLEEIMALPAGKSETLFYLTSSGPWFAESVWSDDEEGVINRHAIKTGIQLAEPITSITLNKGEANNILTLNLVKPTGAVFAYTPSLAYKFSHRPSGHGINVIVPSGLRGSQFKIKVSGLGPDYNFSGAASQTEDNAVIAYLYQLKDGIQNSVSISNTARDFAEKNLISFQNRLSKQDSFVYIGDCNTDYLASGATGYDCAYFVRRNINIIPNTLRKIYVFNSNQRDIGLLKYADYPSFNLLLTLDNTKKFLDKNLYRSPQYYVIGNNFYGWLRGGSYQSFKVEIPPSNVIGFGNGPVFDGSRWYNYANSDNHLLSGGGPNSPLYFLGSYADEGLATEGSATASKLSANYSLKRNGETVSDGRVGLNDSIILSGRLLAGKYEFEMKRDVFINDVSTAVRTVSNFSIYDATAYKKNPIDENPPFLTGLSLNADGFPQNVIDTTLTNKILINVDPAAGLAKVNTYNDYNFMSDSLFSVKLEVSNDGEVWRERTLTDLGNGKFSAVVNVPSDPALSGKLVSFRISAKDATGNTLLSTFQIPTGSGFKDKEPPSVSLALSSPEAIIAGTLNMQVRASDNADIVKVEIYLDEKLIATKVLPPFNFSLDTRAVADGDYILSVKAYDAADNIGVSEKEKINIDNTPPVSIIDSPSEGSIIGGTIVNIFGGATDNTKIKKVEFFLDSVIALGFDDTFPYILSWDSTSVPDGKHVISSKVSDVAGNIGVTKELTVYVENKRRGSSISTSPGATTKPTPTPVSNE